MKISDKVNGELSRWGRFLKRLRTEYLGLLVMGGLVSGGFAAGWTLNGILTSAVDATERLARAEDRTLLIESDLRSVRSSIEHNTLLFSVLVPAFCDEPHSEPIDRSCRIIEFMEEQRQRRQRPR